MQIKNLHIFNFFNAIWKQGEVREIRAFDHNDFIFYGYFDSPEAATISAETLEMSSTVYITLNPVNPALLARAENKIKRAGKKATLTKDDDIIDNRLLLIDCDPFTPVGISSNEEELSKTKEVAEKIIAKVGKPLVYGMSGNGHHLIYQVQGTVEQRKAFLETLKKEFESAETCKIDQVVYNSARITKVLGTWSRKGDSTKTRPHRQSYIIQANEDSKLLILPEVPQKQEPEKQQKKNVLDHHVVPGVFNGWSSFNEKLSWMRNFLMNSGYTVREEKPWKDGILFILESCAFDSSHSGNDAGILVMPGNAPFSYQCFHNSCQAHTWEEFRNICGNPKQYTNVNGITCKYCGSSDLVWGDFERKKRLFTRDGVMHHCKEKTSESKEIQEKTQETTHSQEKKTKTKKQVRIAEYIQKYEELGYNFSMNELTDDLYFNNRLAQDDDIARIRVLLREWGINEKKAVNLAQANDIMIMLAADHKFNPIKTYLSSIPKWDGIDRITEILKSFPCADITAYRWLEIWFSGAIRRIYEDGKHFPSLVLISKKQGVGKSTFAKWLCPERLQKDLYNASQIRPEDKDNRIRLASTWIWEIEELGATTRKADIEALKAFLSAEQIRDRKPYGRIDFVKPAVTAFVGTINDNGGGFLVDPTGNRRFLILNANEMNFDFQKIDIDMIWAQAIHLYHEKKYIMNEDDKREQADANKEHLISSPTETYLDKYYEITSDENDFVPLSDILDILKKCGIQQNHKVSMDVAAFFNKIDTTKKIVKKINGKSTRGYCGIKRNNSDIPNSYTPYGDRY